jgi:hypothetical protein
LLKRLEEIGQSLAQTGQALALIGLGSVGVEMDRLDDYSDLDFFAIVQPGCKAGFLGDLAWLSRCGSIAYCFQNTVDGYKLLFADGVFCEFAIFEPAELAHIPFAVGRIIWKAPGVDDAIRLPVRTSAPVAPRSVEWLMGEAVSCLYVGLCRYGRGEKLSAARFIQHYAVDRLLELAEQFEAETPALKDNFALDRRCEQRFPSLAQELPRFAQGYERSPESALAILDFLDRRFGVNAAMKEQILALCGRLVS